MYSSRQLARIIDDGAPAPIRIPYAPRVEQREYHDLERRFVVLVAHRRLGKTVAAVNQGLRAAIRCPLENAQVAYIAPFRNQAKRVAWAYLLRFTSVIPGSKVDAGELTVHLPNGAKYSLFGGDNVHALRGLYLDYAVIDEVAQMHPMLWGEVIRPALSDRRGGATFIGTPQGRNTFYELYRDAEHLEGWGRLLYTVKQTNIIAPDELLALQREMTADAYAQEYLCDFTAAIRGAYFGREMRIARDEGRITDVPHARELPVHCSVDLGWSDATVIVFWQCAPSGQIRIIDCKAWSGTDLVTIVNELRGLNYSYSGEFALPHDVKVHDLGSGASRYDTLWEAGLRGQLVPKLSHMDGVDAVRTILPRCYFDRTRCAVLIEALEQYRAEYDDKGRVLRQNPLRDWTWDYADAFRYGAISPWSRGGLGFGSQHDLLEQLNERLDRANA